MKRYDLEWGMDFGGYPTDPRMEGISDGEYIRVDELVAELRHCLSGNKGHILSSIRELYYELEQST